MTSAQVTLLAMGGIVLIAVAVRTFGTSLKWAGRAGLNSVLGLGGLIAVDLLPLGIQLGISLQNALVIGLLGLPGFSLLLIFPWLLS